MKRLQRFTEPNPKTIQKSPFTTDERLHHALIALDESLAGKTYRQIAITIFLLVMAALMMVAVP